MAKTKRRLMKLATVYLYDMMDELFDDRHDISLNEFIERNFITFEYNEQDDEGETDAIMQIFIDGELEAEFTLHNI